MSDPVLVNTLKGLSVGKENKNSKPSSKKRQKDSNFRFTGFVPQQRRSSARLQKRIPDYSFLDLPEEKPTSGDHDDLLGLEDVVYRVKKSRKQSAHARIVAPPFLPVQEVTETMIKNIQTRGNKVYGPDGTSCHQCRQKTVDTKTICRSGHCVGVRGQFCGICVINRYGEDPAKALKDPSWKCYVCRGCCNCSFCRLKQGKRPTGILTPLAKQKGYNSVREFLISLQGYGDFVEPNKDPANLLGFENNVAVLGGNIQINLSCAFDILPKKAAKTNVCHSVTYGPEHLLGFQGDVAVMSGNRCINLHCPRYKHTTNSSPIYSKANESHARQSQNPENLLGFRGNVALMGGNTEINLFCELDKLVDHPSLVTDTAHRNSPNLLAWRGDVTRWQKEIPF